MTKKKIPMIVCVISTLLLVAASAFFSDRANITTSAKAGNVAFEIDKTAMDEYVNSESFPFSGY